MNKRVVVVDGPLTEESILLESRSQRLVALVLAWIEADRLTDEGRRILSMLRTNLYETKWLMKE